VSGFHAADADEARALSEQGYRMIGISSDADLLARAARRVLTGLGRPIRDDPSDAGLVQTVLWDRL
jgi:hypothetical protein